MALEQDLLTLEEQFWTGGPEAYERHCDARCLVAFSTMCSVMAREEIAATAEPDRWTDVAITPLAFLQPGDDVATIAYDCTARRKDGQAHAARVTSTYVRRSDGWKLAAHQQAERGG
jgi:ketosteroid isomerase-like protein